MWKTERSLSTCAEALPTEEERETRQNAVADRRILIDMRIIETECGREEGILGRIIIDKRPGQERGRECFWKTKDHYQKAHQHNRERERERG